MSADAAPEELRELISHDPESPELIWRVSRRGVRAGSVAGSLNSNGYVVVRVKGGILRAHRIAWALHYGEWPADQLDHVNGDRTDNRIANLREVTNQENLRNAKKFAHNTSGVTGVYWHIRSHRWAAQIGSPRSGTRRHLGYFEDLEDAVAARKAAEAEENYSPLHGEDEVTRWLLA